MSSHLHNRVSVLAWVCYSIVQSVLLPFSLSTSGVDSHSRLRVCVLVVYFISHSQELSLVRLELLIYGPAGGACHNFLTLKSPVPPPHKLLHTGWRPALTSPPCSYVRTCSAAVCLQRSQFVRMFPQEYHECLSCPHALAIARAICASVFVSQLCVCVCRKREEAYQWGRPSSSSFLAWQLVGCYVFYLTFVRVCKFAPHSSAHKKYTL